MHQEEMSSWVFLLGELHEVLMSRYPLTAFKSAKYVQLLQCSTSALFQNLYYFLTAIACYSPPQWAESGDTRQHSTSCAS
jgi:hypothetical protein